MRQKTKAVKIQETPSRLSHSCCAMNTNKKKRMGACTLVKYLTQHALRVRRRSMGVFSLSCCPMRQHEATADGQGQHEYVALEVNSVEMARNELMPQARRCPLYALQRNSCPWRVELCTVHNSATSFSRSGVQNCCLTYFGSQML